MPTVPTSNDSCPIVQNSFQPERVEVFVQLLGQHQRRIALYVMSLIANRTDAEEILQETHLKLWREFDQFQLGTNFSAWACRVAYHQVLAWRKRRQRDRLEFSETFLDVVGREAESSAEELEERVSALVHCMDRLPSAQRELLTLRYTHELKIEEVALRVGRTVEAAYRALSRVRQLLHDCVTRTLACKVLDNGDVR